MVLRGVLAVAVVIAGVGISVRFVTEPVSNHGEAPVEGIAPAADPSPVSVLLPLSLGSPAHAALGTRRPAALEPPPKPDEATRARLYQRVLRTASGDTLSGVLRKAGVSGREAHAAISALGKFYDPRRMMPGQEITLTFKLGEPDKPGDGNARPGRFMGFSLLPDIKSRVVVARQSDGGFSASQQERLLTRNQVRIQGTIQSSLFMAADKAGVPPSVLAELIRAYSWDVDFQRDIQPGDAFQVLFERLLDEQGRVIRAEGIVFASLTLSGKHHRIYRHELEDGQVDYFDEAGKSARKALMRTPINGARISSGYGKRRHPVLRYTKMHQGVDFSAAKGTPIYAAGDGTITRAGRNGAYGKYVRIRHNEKYSTAYAHMSRIAKSARPGKRFKQGDVIGFVGSTGRTTGPHLHYEILRNGRQVNPLKVKMPSGYRLKGKELDRFQAMRAETDLLFAALKPDMSVARGN